MSRISLSAAMSSNLRALKSLSGQMNKTQEHLSSGLKVNSAIDNASSYYQARSLSSRAADLEALLDSLGQGIQAIEAANAGLEHATGILEQMSSITEQTIAEPVFVPHEVKIEFKDTAAELLATGEYTAITKDMTAAQINNILKTDNAKVVLADDINLKTSGISATGKNIVINGGGHKLTTGSITMSGANVTIENIEIDSTQKSTRYFQVLYCTGANSTIRDVKVVAEGIKGDGRAIRVDNSSTLENIEIKMSGEESSKSVTGVFAYTDAAVKISNLSADMSGARSDATIAAVYTSGSKTTLESLGMKASGAARAYGAVGAVKGVATEAANVARYVDSLYNGEANTKAIVDQLGAKAQAAQAALLFTPTADLKDDAELGQGTWYLPAIGELMDVYGTDVESMTNSYGTSGATGGNKTIINNTLKKLKESGAEAQVLTNGWYWSSSEYNFYDSWRLDMSIGNRYDGSKTSNYIYVRTFQLLENCFSSLVLSDAHPEGVGGASAPQIGDVLYSDRTYGKVEDYKSAVAAEGGRAAVGVVTWVSEDGQALKAMSLKNLSFSSPTAKNNFDPANPYNNTSTTTRWSNVYTDVEAVENVNRYDLALSMSNKTPVVTVDKLNAAFADLSAESSTGRYNEALTEYDNLINDSSYQGVNLLKGGKLELTFNETRSNKFAVAGKDISAQALGINQAEWTKLEDIAASVKELQSAISSLRAFAGELGNSYGIIQTRQDFTGALTEVLETGADNLLLADMNEESANYLALQTRQQLAVNSLSLAAESAQSILSLF